MMSSVLGWGGMGLPDWGFLCPPGMLYGIFDLHPNSRLGIFPKMSAPRVD